MKKIMLSIVLASIIFTVSAQDKKPTKEETQRFLNSLLLKVLGEKCTGTYLIKKQSFNADFSSYEFFEGDNNGWKTENITLIKWQELSEFEEFKEDKNKNLRFIRLTFNSKIKDIVDYNCCVVKGTETFTNSFSFYVSANDYNSTKKACLRLAEIAKEENKDPFKN